MIVGTQHKVPAPWAALANGTAGHADEFDAVHATADFRGTGHPAAIIVPAATAMAERQLTNGRELVNAVALGYDVGARIISTTDGLGPLRHAHGIYAGSLHGLGAAASCARLLGLDAQRHLFALALASNQTISLNAFFGERRHMSKAFVEGQAAFAGAAGSLMAAAGFEASDNILEDPEGLLDTWAVDGRAGELSKDLGVDYAVMGINFKFYSAGYPIHSAVEAALTITGGNDIAPESIDRIEIRMPSYAASVVDGRSMPTICIQDMVAVAIVAGKLGFDEAHSMSLLRHPEVQRLRSLVEVIRDPDFDREQPHGRGSKVTIGTAEAAHQEKVEHPRGHRFRTPPPTWSEVRDKWEEIMVVRLGASRFNELFDACCALETVDNVAELRRLLSTTEGSTTWS